MLGQELSSLFQESKTVVQRVFCWLFHCEQFLNRWSRVRSILAPQTAGVRASSRPRKVLSCQEAPCLELVEAGGKALVGTCHRRIRLLLGITGLKSFICWLRLGGSSLLFDFPMAQFPYLRKCRFSVSVGLLHVNGRTPQSMTPQLTGLCRNV